MARTRGDTLKPGDAVKLNGHAFDNGVYERTSKTRGYRGLIIRGTRGDPDLFAIKWDHRKTLEKLHRSFLMRATTAAMR